MLLISFVGFASVVLVLVRRHRARTREPRSKTTCDQAFAWILGWCPVTRGPDAITRQAARYAAAERLPITIDNCLAPSGVELGLHPLEFNEIVDRKFGVELAMTENMKVVAEQFGRRPLGAPWARVYADPDAGLGWPTVHAVFQAIDQGGRGPGGETSSAETNIGVGAVIAPRIRSRGRVGNGGPASQDGTIVPMDPARSLVEAETAKVARVLVLRDGRRFPIPEEGQVGVGRGTGIDVEILAPQVSRRHALVHCAGAAVYVEDLDSANGTFVDGSRIFGRVEVSDGSVIRLGSGSHTLRLAWERP